MNKFLYINNNIDINIGEEEVLINDFKRGVTHVLNIPYNNVFINLLNHQEVLDHTILEEVSNFILENQIGVFTNKKYTYEHGGISTFNLRVYERELQIKTLTIFANKSGTTKSINGCYKAKKYVGNLELKLLDRINLYVDKIIINVGYHPDCEVLSLLSTLCDKLIIIINNDFNIKLMDEYTYILSINQENINSLDTQYLNNKNVFLNVEDDVCNQNLQNFDWKIVNQSYEKKDACTYQRNLNLKAGNVTEYRRYYHPCISMQIAMDLNGNLYYCSEYDKPFLRENKYKKLKEIFNDKENYAKWIAPIEKKQSCRICGYRYHCNDCIVAYDNGKNFNCMKSSIDVNN